MLEVCTAALNLFRQITIYLSPVLPALSEKASALLNADPAEWRDEATPLQGNVVNPFEHLMARVDTDRLAAIVAASVEAPS